jgi:hypothetical protein
VPIIFITAHADVPMTVQAMKGDAMEFLKKPFRDQDLIDAVEAGLARDRARRESDKALAGLRERFDRLSSREREIMPQQGCSVALSADGNIAIVGGYNDNNLGPAGAGAAWVFTRSGGVWTQQGPNLVGTGAVGAAHQGSSVALSADGNTAIVGGEWDNDLLGATWVFIRSSRVWTQQGPKLIGTGAVGAASQGSSVAVSANGNTLIVSGIGDDNWVGAAWVFIRSGGKWLQQGPKLVGSSAVGESTQGISVAPTVPPPL